MASLGLSFPICRIWVVFVCYNHCNKTPPTRWLQPAGNPTLPVLQTDPGVSRASERLGRLLPRLLLASGHGHNSWPVLTCDCIPPASASVTTWCPPPCLVSLPLLLSYMDTGYIGGLKPTCLPSWWLTWQRICLQCRRPGWGKSPGEGNGYPLQQGLENSMDRGTWKATVHGVAELDTTERLSLSQLPSHLL